MLYSTGNVTAVLVARKAGHMPNNPGQLVFPGGRIEEETPQAAALREFNEETGVAIHAATMQLVSRQTYVVLRIDTVDFGGLYSATFVRVSLEDLTNVRRHVWDRLSRNPGELVDVDVVTPLQARATFLTEHQPKNARRSTEWFSAIADRVRTGFG